MGQSPERGGGSSLTSPVKVIGGLFQKREDGGTGETDGKRLSNSSLPGFRLSLRSSKEKKERKQEKEKEKEEEKEREKEREEVLLSEISEEREEISESYTRPEILPTPLSGGSSLTSPVKVIGGLFQKREDGGTGETDGKRLSNSSLPGFRLSLRSSKEKKERKQEKEKEKEEEKEREKEREEVLLSEISEEREEISESYTRPEILPTPLSGGSSLTSPVKVIGGLFQKREDGGTGETDGKRLSNSSLPGFRLSLRSSKEKKERKQEKEKEKEEEKEREKEREEVLLSEISEEREEISESYTRPEILPTPLSGGSSLTSPVKVIGGLFQKREDGGTGETDGKRLSNSSLPGFRLSLRSSKEKKERKQEKEKEKEEEKEREKEREEVLLSEISEEREEISESYTRPEILPTPLSGGSSLTSPVKVIGGLFQKREDGGTGETDGKRLSNSSLPGFRLSLRSSKEKKERKQEKEKEKEEEKEREKEREEVLLSEISEEREEISESYTRPEILPTPLSGGSSLTSPVKVIGGLFQKREDGGTGETDGKRLSNSSLPGMILYNTLVSHSTIHSSITL
ncbi:hypothetical protein NHX12_020003 [Muraenolepis orangiensis]|uniref:Uncharacterized protein n=1 Tax=Muraenolepis orangiensis TaxID=630683 RepID=A0A9Q0EZG7_9TELE|nr:hypothetical protein NHX12_020003 [Muraenolepis orangiensis]